MQGFVNDSSYTNPCDPNSMQDLGQKRNSVYTLNVVDRPDAKKRAKSKLPKQS
jgi:hypothetical protein